ncbi:MAG: hypothetical protein ABIQ02_00210 [Saprospiraceae bacterium]
MNKFSKITLFFLIVFLASTRLNYFKWESPNNTQVLTWDAFGYYVCMPGFFIYHDIKKFEWIPQIIEKYQPTGTLYQLKELPNGNKVMKYLIGVSILYSPFFLMGHFIAGALSYPQDGFSTPYQAAVCLAALFYAFLGLFVLRKILLRFFSDLTTTVTLLLIALATNYIQYVSVDSAMAHGFIFSLYSILLLVTISWHDKPSFFKAFTIGLFIGLGAISRPTEIIMLFIPLLYSTQDKTAMKAKWKLVAVHRFHIIALVAGALLAAFPQLLYWKIITGYWIHEVGSKWVFFHPNWQVLFGWEKGWFIYTPVAILMVLGFFNFRKNPFYYSVLVFFLVNIWIVIAWFDWRYGASYSARAFVQSYAVMALPMAAIINKRIKGKFRYLLVGLFAFLIYLNLFQIWQYNKGILHYNEMNRLYYSAIFLNCNPTPLQMSLLDTKEYPKDERKLNMVREIRLDSQYVINASKISNITLYKSELNKLLSLNSNTENWFRIQISVLSAWGAFDTFLTTRVVSENQSKETRCRMQNGIYERMKWNSIEYYFMVPQGLDSGIITIVADTKAMEDIYIKDLSIKILVK